MARNKPKYRGRTINKIQNKVTGDIGHPALNTLLDQDAEVVLVVTGTVGSINYKTTAEGTVCVQTIKALSGYIVEDELDGVDLLHQLHAKRVDELDKPLGTTAGEGDEE